MRKLTYLLTIILGLLSACNSKNSSTSRLLVKPEVIEELKYQKAEIDSFYSRNKDNVLIFVKPENKENVIQVLANNEPENIERTFNVLKNSLGNIITISELPFSKSGDWCIVWTYYFDKNGKTFAFEKQTNFFNSNCTEGVAYETETKFFNSNFDQIFRNYKLVDINNKPLNKDSCSRFYDYKYEVLANVDDYLKINKIKTSR